MAYIRKPFPLGRQILMLQILSVLQYSIYPVTQNAFLKQKKKLIHTLRQLKDFNREIFYMICILTKPVLQTVHCLILFLTLCMHPFFVVCGFVLKFFQKIFQEYHQNVKQLGSRTGPTFCRAWSGSKLFAKVISRRQNCLVKVCCSEQIWV